MAKKKNNFLLMTKKTLIKLPLLINGLFLISLVFILDILGLLTNIQMLFRTELAQLNIKYFIDSTPPATYPTFTATSLLIQLIFSHYIHATQLG